MLNEDNILKDNIKDFRLLTEWVNRNDVVEAIKNHDVIYIYYVGDDTVNRGFRTIEPYALGRSKAGNLVLRAWQQAGASDSEDYEPKEQPNARQFGWRLFRLDGITSFLNTMKKFATKKENIRPKYNADDKQMTEVIVSVDPNVELDIQTKGMFSVIEPDVLINPTSVFDQQRAKFQNFYSAAQNKEMLFKKTVGDFYNLIKLQQKKDPIRYILVNKNGRVWYDLEKNKDKYDEKDLHGNLNNLYRKLYNVNTFKVDKSFIENQRKKFMDALKKQAQI